MSRSDILDAYLPDPAAGWSMGTFGAIGEFMRDPDEVAQIATGGPVYRAATARGGLSIDASSGWRAVAYETATGSDGWSQAVALCLPEPPCLMHRRTALTELGQDTEALRNQDRDSLLFDLGLGVLQADVCIRTADPSLIDVLRTNAGRSLFEPGNPAMPAILSASPHRVFLTRIGRLEVFQPIPAADSRSPQGPHTHILPRLLQSGRTHAATAPIPAGWVPCAHLHPPHPLKDMEGRAIPFRPERLDGWLALLRRHAPAELYAWKQRVLADLAAGVDPPAGEASADRHARMVVKATIRQAIASGKHVRRGSLRSIGCSG
ncbi:DUF6925 family protein [Marinivivus vitaminiproducens]|uniref:DUF6925 family protein n=1 Tax=Marinivivus vitaminiproducens TaxID=3035935 RepID=UPI00279CAB3B|nr:hypothetical protein P4R82_10750 [Geminicoccaceae bacterium SCSIO 64248]